MKYLNMLPLLFSSLLFAPSLEEQFMHQKNDPDNAVSLLKKLEDYPHLYGSSPIYAIPYAEIIYQIRIARYVPEFFPSNTAYNMLEDQLYYMPIEFEHLETKDIQPTVKLILDNYYDLLLQHIKDDYAYVPSHKEQIIHNAIHWLKSLI